MLNNDGDTPAKITRMPSASAFPDETWGTGTNWPLDHATTPFTVMVLDVALVTGTLILPIAAAS
jgi:hypothetical protein